MYNTSLALIGKMEELSLDIFDNNSRFILKYLEKKKSHAEKFDQFILSLNSINEPIDRFMSDALIIKMEYYVELLEKTDKSYKLRLTDNGLDLVKYIKRNDTIINNNVFIKSVRFIYLIISGFVNIFSHTLSLMISARFIKAIAKIITYIGILITIGVGVLQLIKWYNTGQI